MSVAPQPDVEQTYECAHCGGDRTAPTSVAGSFCSTACHDAHRREKRAREALNILQQDHRFCFTCGAQLKTVHKPNRTLVVGPSRHDDWAAASDVLVGYQTRTPNARTGEKTRRTSNGYPDAVTTGTICRCGQTDHREAEPTIRNRRPFSAAHRIARALSVLRSEEKHDVHLDRDRLDAALCDHATVREALVAAVVL